MPPSLKDKNTKPSANEWGQLNALLAKLGMTPEQRKVAIGDKNDKTRGELADALRVWLKEQS